jgi:serine phosphatase RsbU (regulator of sigma subunit)
VYLDSRLAKGLFTHDDLDVLVAIGQHLAIAVETARSARVEAERQELERELALTAAVQSMFFPSVKTHAARDLEVCAFHRSATQCSGDWWWIETFEDGRVHILMGDVTGHGAAPAMVTASVASAYQVLRKKNLHSELRELVPFLNEVLLELADQKFMMTLCALELDTRTNAYAAFLAGAPPLLLARENGEVDTIGGSSCPLGTREHFEVSEESGNLLPGDRLLIFSDGISEIELSGERQLGLKRLTRMLGRVAHQRPEQAIDALMRELDGLNVEKRQRDDMTLIMVGNVGKRGV